MSAATEWADRSSWQELGEALRAVGEGASGGQLAAVLHKDSSNITKLADELVTAGLLRRVPPIVPPGRRGRRPDYGYGFAQGQLQRLDALLPAPGGLHSEQQVVVAEAPRGRVSDLMQVLSDAELVARASWAALLQGDPNEYLVVYEGPERVEAALSLLAALEGAEVQARVVGTVKVEPAHRLLQEAGRLVRAEQASRVRRETRRASSNS